MPFRLLTLGVRKLTEEEHVPDPFTVKPPLPSLSSGWAESAKHPLENLLDALSNYGPAVRLYRERRGGRERSPPEDRYGRLSWRFTRLDPEALVLATSLTSERSSSKTKNTRNLNKIR